MLEHDEWVVPGEVEYAEKKVAEIEAQLQRYYETADELTGRYWNFSMMIQFTEHVFGKFKVSLAEYMISPPDIDVTNEMLLDWFRDQVAPIDEPKIFDLPADDIRNSLPEWNESLLPDDSWKRIMRMHSSLYMVVKEIEKMDGNYDKMERQLNLSKAKFVRVMETLVKKLYLQNGPVVFTDLEEKIVDCLLNYIDDWDYRFCGYYYKLWHFPMEMTENDINDAICTAYLNASKRSRRILPDKFDFANMQVIYLENYECLYQGKAGDMLIRFLFDFKNMKIVEAYPVLKERICNKENYYDKSCKLFLDGDIHLLR